MENTQNFQKILFGIGSNLGDKNLNILNAVEQLKKFLFLKDIKISTIYKNPAMLPPHAPSDWNKEFYNIAISANIDMKNFTPLKILEIIKIIEKKIGRKDSERWAPREIDIDILAIDKIYFKNDDLSIPHSGIFERDFFIKTICEIEQDFFWNLKSFFNK